jgi:hypothetical protein
MGWLDMVWYNFVVRCDPLCPLWPFVHLCGSYLVITLCPFVIYLNSTEWVFSACNFNLVNSMLLIDESSVGAFLLTALYLIYLDITLCISFISCTCRVPTISVLNLAIFLCHSNLLIRSWRRSGVHRYGVLGERLPPVDCLWCYGVFPLQCFRECST